MRIPIEIMLRGNNQVFTENLEHPGEPAQWTEADAAAVLKGMLMAISRAQNPEAGDEPDVVLRGVNWIVHPSDGGVVIALEIHSASAVAGPIPTAQATLDTLITRAVSGGRPRQRRPLSGPVPAVVAAKGGGAGARWLVAGALASFAIAAAAPRHGPGWRAGLRLLHRARADGRARPLGLAAAGGRHPRPCRRLRRLRRLRAGRGACQRPCPGSGSCWSG